MSIGSIQSNLLSIELGNINQTSSTSLYSTQTSGSAAYSWIGSDSAEISKTGDFFSKLQQLQEADPDKFTEVVSDIADQLEEAAANTDDEDEKERLTELAEKFQSVADGEADISTLQPPPPPEAGQSGYSNAIGTDSGSAGMFPPPPPPGSDSSSSDLFSSIYDQIDEALAEVLGTSS